MATILARQERDRLVELIDLLNDTSVTQLDNDELIELLVLWRKLRDGQ